MHLESTSSTKTSHIHVFSLFSLHAFKPLHLDFSYTPFLQSFNSPFHSAVLCVCDAQSFFILAVAQQGRSCLATHRHYLYELGRWKREGDAL